MIRFGPREEKSEIPFFVIHEEFNGEHPLILFLFAYIFLFNFIMSKFPFWNFFKRQSCLHSYKLIYSPLNALKYGVQFSRFLKSPETWNTKALVVLKLWYSRHETSLLNRSIIHAWFYIMHFILLLWLCPNTLTYIAPNTTGLFKGHITFQGNIKLLPGSICRLKVTLSRIFKSTGFLSVKYFM